MTRRRKAIRTRSFFFWQGGMDLFIYREDDSRNALGVGVGDGWIGEDEEGSLICCRSHMRLSFQSGVVYITNLPLPSDMERDGG
ncbi:hypothetical protein CEXT_160851 [Caerostris extrusa]|uniref:Uncharacterized protein n=1 Tax=Caerostris extrusa TaxID=172846 RepID=A0AAV4UZM2_CAEEX|nr:hypothetical protein CEXT_160851 [Caerostris extrusa]